MDESTNIHSFHHHKYLLKSFAQAVDYEILGKCELCCEIHPFLSYVFTYVGSITAIKSRKRSSDNMMRNVLAVDMPSLKL
jgi:hypothetical protein